MFSLSSWTRKFAHGVLEIVFRQHGKICTFHFGERHRGFLADIDVNDTGSGTIKSFTPKHGDIR